MSAQANTNCHDIKKKCRRHGPIWPKLERHDVSSATCRDMSATFPAKGFGVFSNAFFEEIHFPLEADHFHPIKHVADFVVSLVA